MPRYAFTASRVIFLDVEHQFKAESPLLLAIIEADTMDEARSKGIAMVLENVPELEIDQVVTHVTPEQQS